MTKITNQAEAADLLGCPNHEVAAVGDHEGHPVVEMFDGHRYIVVDDEVMYFGKPHADYNGSFPVFTVAPEEDEADEPGAGAEEAPEEDEAGAGTKSDEGLPLKGSGAKA